MVDEKDEKPMTTEGSRSQSVGRVERPSQKAKPFDELVGELAEKEILKQHAEKTLRLDALSYMSYLMREVDVDAMTMPQARQKLAAWYRELPDKSLAKVAGRARMRRLKQIMDAMFEEFWNVTSQE